jgi:hypothetical protein
MKLTHYPIFINGDGTFQPQVNYPVSGASYLTAADFNRDGKVDLAISTSANGVVVVLNSGGAPILQRRVGP